MKITRRDILLGAGAGLVTTAATGMARAQSQGHDMSQMKEPAAPAGAMEGMDHSGMDMPATPDAPAAPAAAPADAMDGMDHGGMDMPATPPAATPTPVDHSQHGAPPASPASPTDDEKETEEDTPPPPDHSAHGDTP